MRRRLRFLLLPLALSAALGGLTITSTARVVASAAATCTPRLLVLSARPLELDPMLAHAEVDPGSTAVIDNRYFVTGTVGGQPVILGLTGIGPENAQTTTSDVFAHYQCAGVSQISGAVFSGTAGGDFIGDVFVPRQWTMDGQVFEQADPTMYAVAQGAAPHAVLEQTTPSGDPACVCGSAGGVTTPVTVEHVPTVELGGSGLTSDPFGGRTLPCAPAGSDIDNCVPCRELDHTQVAQAGSFATGIVPFADPGFFTGYLRSTTPSGAYVTSDEETAVVARVAAAHGVPFIGFRAASDGPGNSPGTGGDPLHLPGFPAQFAVYKQLAADNAAAVTVAFLEAWATRP